MTNLEQKIEERHNTIVNLKGYMAGWLARHDPEELDRLRGIEVDSEDNDWLIN